MKLAFYNGRSEGAKFAHKAILLLSDPYTHVELVFDDEESFSSEFGVGPRMKKITYSHPERWKFVELPWLLPAQKRRIRYRAELHNALRIAGLENYDLHGAISCVATGHNNPWNWFCSEVVYDVLAPEIAIPDLNCKMHPQKLLQVIEIVRDLRK